MKISRLSAPAAVAATVVVTAVPAIAATPYNQYNDIITAAPDTIQTDGSAAAPDLLHHNGFTSVPGKQHQARDAGNLTSTVGSLAPCADSSGLFQWGGPNSLTAITLKVKPHDSRCDGVKIGIRLVTIPYHGAKHYWPWHGCTTGCGRTYTYNTYAQDSNGIHYATVELGLFRGSRLEGTGDAPLSKRPSS
ncbi:hypothetical protein ABT173_47330 [Streptomyces sp. NPDC001795]|uniref:hypothetical protein n=1 Tax=unclassified Streptomyces TaxID=2593676 RepID=UPI00332A51FF